MTTPSVPTRSRLSATARLVVSASFAVLLSATSVGAGAFEAAPPTGTTAPDAALHALEAAFWRCDHAATQGLLDFGAAAICSRLTEELKRKRFDGDFEAMLLWWQRNKASAHDAIDAALSAALVRWQLNECLHDGRGKGKEHAANGSRADAGEKHEGCQHGQSVPESGRFLQTRLDRPRRPAAPRAMTGLRLASWAGFVAQGPMDVERQYPVLRLAPPSSTLRS